MKKISKSVFLNSLQCPILGWRLRNGEVTPAGGLGDKFRIEQGLRIGEIARKLFPEGVLIEDRNLENAARKTENLIHDNAILSIFECTFIFGNLTAKADILNKNENGWVLYEVKSSVNDHPEFIEDMAYTTLVLSLSGVPLADIKVLLVSRDFRLGMNENNLFIETTHTEKVFEKVKEFRYIY